MLPNNGDEIIISGYLSSFITSVTGGFGVQYGAAFMFTWSGITGSAGVSQQYYFELTIRRNSAAQVLASAMIETGVNDATNWGSLQKRKWTTAAVDLTINNTLSLAVDSGTGAFNADEMVSRTFKITQLLS
jgi:hypothetical protein